MNKISLPTAIIITGIILGIFFYAIQINKQNSIEKQQHIDLVEKNSKEMLATSQRKSCMDQAEISASTNYKEYCLKNDYCMKTYEPGTYLKSSYEYDYNRCLESKGLK